MNRPGGRQRTSLAGRAFAHRIRRWPGRTQSPHCRLPDCPIARWPGCPCCVVAVAPFRNTKTADRARLCSPYLRIRGTQARRNAGCAEQSFDHAPVCGVVPSSRFRADRWQGPLRHDRLPLGGLDRIGRRAILFFATGNRGNRGNRNGGGLIGRRVCLGHRVALGVCGQGNRAIGGKARAQRRQQRGCPSFGRRGFNHPRRSPVGGDRHARPSAGLAANTGRPACRRPDRRGGSPSAPTPPPARRHRSRWRPHPARLPAG